MVTLAVPDARLVPSYLEAHAEFAAIGEGHRDGDGFWVEQADEQYDGVTFTRAELETARGRRAVRAVPAEPGPRGLAATGRPRTVHLPLDRRRR